MRISLVVPVFNEEDAIPIFYKTVRNLASLAQYEIEIVFVNDGSKDKTCDIANALALVDPLVTLINFSRNFGKEPALFAGLEYATGDAVIPIDVDLQDPIEIIPLLIEKWQSGVDVVLAKRVDRQADGYLKRRSAEAFYSLHNKISNPIIEENVGDFRLMSRQVVDEIKKLPERNLFMKGILSWVGFNTEVVEYVRAERVAGKTKFNGWKLWNLALEGITSFSTFPLRIWSYIGLGVALFSFLYAAWMVVDKLIWGNVVPGYPSLMTAMLFLGGVQLIGIGVLGEYIGRIYIESKNRPRYIVKDIVK
ncbi:glycosyltransferase family 2 protein [Janthinobacterium lividum]|uniref:glycosyltransferase family 2 protein n=1 Tax=Janthinobacterium TaxID=29580 RepID=UPI001C5AEF62|nr:glycosyltransferase family 2 protein [Janthinobacterium sp. NKUCC06_STL]MCA1861398.1 glycosyltransferase family 2 protein [Janthinobacterium lividum]